MAYDAGNHAVHTSATISMNLMNNDIWSLLEGANDYTLYASRCNTLNITMRVDSVKASRDLSHFRALRIHSPT